MKVIPLLVFTSLIITFFPISISADTIPPEITNVKAVPSETWQGEEVKITCVVTDNVAVDRVKIVIKYPDDSIANMTMQKVGRTNHYEYTDTYDVVGTYIFYIWANDTSGNWNISSNYTFTIKKDDIPPITYCNLYGTLGNDSWYVSDVMVKLYADDTGMGVKNIYYTINGDIWLEYTAPFKIDSEGITKLYYYSEDYAGNKERIKYKTVKIDKSMPTTICNISGEKGVSGWFISDVTIKLFAEDEISGINKTFYRIDNEEWKEYEEAIVFSEDGVHNISYYSIDNAGNIEEEKSETFKIDKVHPQVLIHKPREGYLYVENREIMPTITGKTIIIGYITIEVGATNHESGINRVEFYIDNNFQTADFDEPYEWTWDYLSFGTHQIKAVAYDNAGNYGSNEITVWIINI